MINEVCHKIKEKRRVLGYSIEYVVEKTKLYPSVIEDIEARNLDNISPTYLKGFMKIYASFLEVDLGTALEEIDPLKPTTKRIKKEKGKDNAESESSKERRVIIKRIGEALKKISPEVKKKIAIIFAGIILLWGFLITSRLIVRGVSKIFKERTKKSETASQPVVPPPIEEVEGVEVSLTARRKCFLRVEVDEKLLFEGILNKEAVETWRGDKEIELRISDGSAVLLEVNGRPIPILASIRKPIKSLRITSSGISVDK